MRLSPRFTGGFLELPATVGQVVGPPLIDPSSSTATSDRLVGHCPLVVIQVNAVKVRCLVETGSQVTLFSKSLVKELFSAQCLQEAEAPWFILRGANGLDISCIGYLVTDLEIHGITVPQKGVVFVRDPCLGTHQALLGMNVITDYWEELFQARPIRTAPPAEKREWERIIADCRRFTRPDPNETAKVPAGLLVDIPFLFQPRVWLLSGIGCPLRRMDQKIGYSLSPIWTVRLWRWLEV